MQPQDGFQISLSIRQEIERGSEIDCPFSKLHPSHKTCSFRLLGQEPDIDVRVRPRHYRMPEHRAPNLADEDLRRDNTWRGGFSFAVRYGEDPQYCAGSSRDAGEGVCSP